MLVARAPMRLSFAGGGTDLPAYYEKHGGMVVSTAIDKYVYVLCSKNGFDSLQISSSDYSTFVRHEGGGEIEPEGKLRYARAFLRESGIRSGYSVFMASEMPPGTGLGSSSALAVALTKAFGALHDELPPKAEVAERAASVELGKLEMPIGKQDQYASAFGGLNAIYFSGQGVEVEPLKVGEATREWLSRSILIFFTEQAHNSAEILTEQQRRSEQDADTINALHEIKGHAKDARRALLEGQPERLGEIMHRGWLAKRKLAQGITNELIDRAYADALKAGALGGKIAGAGGGGFLMLVVPEERRADVSRRMATHGLVQSDFHFESVGARVLVNSDAA
jgi:D-glycero-alpha-D-manno-heptose-7-phosphate kinase